MEQKTLESPVDGCEALLVKSITIYQEVAKCYASLQTAAEQLGAANDQALARLDLLFAEAHIVEALLREQLPAAAELPPGCLELIEERSALLAAALVANRSLSSRASGIHALLRHELASSTRNRTALRGYRLADPGRPGMLSGSC
jgi:hypothetical protein